MQYALYTNKIHHGLLQFNDYSCSPHSDFFGEGGEQMEIVLYSSMLRWRQMGCDFSQVCSSVSESSLNMKVGSSVLWIQKGSETDHTCSGISRWEAGILDPLRSSLSSLWCHAQMIMCNTGLQKYLWKTRKEFMKKVQKIGERLSWKEMEFAWFF